MPPFSVLAAAPLARLRSVITVRPETRCDVLMRQLMRERVHLAIVSSEAGMTLGLVTLEDLVEEFVGDIRDEHDDPTGGVA